MAKQRDTSPIGLSQQMSPEALIRNIQNAAATMQSLDPKALAPYREPIGIVPGPGSQQVLEAFASGAADVNRWDRAETFYRYYIKEPDRLRDLVDASRAKSPRLKQEIAQIVNDLRKLVSTPEGREMLGPESSRLVNKFYPMWVSEIGNFTDPDQNFLNEFEKKSQATIQKTPVWGASAEELTGLSSFNEQSRANLLESVAQADSFGRPAVGLETQMESLAQYLESRKLALAGDIGQHFTNFVGTLPATPAGGKSMAQKIAYTTGTKPVQYNIRGTKSTITGPEVLDQMAGYAIQKFITGDVYGLENIDTRFGLHKKDTSGRSPSAAELGARPREEFVPDKGDRKGLLNVGDSRQVLKNAIRNILPGQEIYGETDVIESADLESGQVEVPRSFRGAPLQGTGNLAPFERARQALNDEVGLPALSPQEFEQLLAAGERVQDSAAEAFKSKMDYVLDAAAQGAKVYDAEEGRYITPDIYRIFETINPDTGKPRQKDLTPIGYIGEDLIKQLSKTDMTGQGLEPKGRPTIRKYEDAYGDEGMSSREQYNPLSSNRKAFGRGQAINIPPDYDFWDLMQAHYTDMYNDFAAYETGDNWWVEPYHYEMDPNLSKAVEQGIESFWQQFPELKNTFAPEVLTNQKGDNPAYFMGGAFGGEIDGLSGLMEFLDTQVPGDTWRAKMQALETQRSPQALAELGIGDIENNIRNVNAGYERTLYQGGIPEHLAVTGMTQEEFNEELGPRHPGRARDVFFLQDLLKDYPYLLQFAKQNIEATQEAHPWGYSDHETDWYADYEEGVELKKEYDALPESVVRGYEQIVKSGRAPQLESLAEIRYLQGSNFTPDSRALADQELSRLLPSAASRMAMAPTDIGLGGDAGAVLDAGGRFGVGVNPDYQQQMFGQESDNLSQTDVNYASLQEEIEAMNKANLAKIAKQIGVKGRSRMNKAALKQQVLSQIAQVAQLPDYADRLERNRNLANAAGQSGLPVATPSPIQQPQVVLQGWDPMFGGPQQPQVLLENWDPMAGAPQQGFLAGTQAADAVANEAAADPQTASEVVTESEGNLRNLINFFQGKAAAGATRAKGLGQRGLGLASAIGSDATAIGQNIANALPQSISQTLGAGLGTAADLGLAQAASPVIPAVAMIRGLQGGANALGNIIDPLSNMGLDSARSAAPKEAAKFKTPAALAKFNPKTNMMESTLNLTGKVDITPGGGIGGVAGLAGDAYEFIRGGKEIARSKQGHNVWNLSEGKKTVVIGKDGINSMTDLINYLDGDNTDGMQTRDGEMVTGGSHRYLSKDDISFMKYTLGEIQKDIQSGKYADGKDHPKMKTINKYVGKAEGIDVWEDSSDAEIASSQTGLLPGVRDVFQTMEGERQVDELEADFTPAGTVYTPWWSETTGQAGSLGGLVDTFESSVSATLNPALGFYYGMEGVLGRSGREDTLGEGYRIAGDGKYTIRLRDEVDPQALRFTRNDTSRPEEEDEQWLSRIQAVYDGTPYANYRYWKYNDEDGSLTNRATGTNVPKEQHGIENYKEKLENHLGETKELWENRNSINRVGAENKEGEILDKYQNRIKFTDKDNGHTTKDGAGFWGSIGETVGMVLGGQDKSKKDYINTVTLFSENEYADGKIAPGKIEPYNRDWEEQTILTRPLSFLGENTWDLLENLAPDRDEDGFRESRKYTNYQKQVR